MPENNKDNLVVFQPGEWLISASQQSTKAFDCGDAYLNKFVKKLLKAKLASKEVSATFATLNDQLIGYSTLKIYQCRDADLIDDPRPVLMVDQVAVDQKAQGQGIGSELLARMMDSAELVSRHVPVCGLALWSHPDALDFYKSIGFEDYGVTMMLKKLKLRLLLLKIEDIAAALA